MEAACLFEIVKLTSMSNHPSPFSPRVEQAIELAAKWHDLTYRKSRWREAAFDVAPQDTLRVPVMAHVTAVALIVQRMQWDDDVVAAAFLHDAIEDVNRYGMVMRKERLAELMGPRITELVLQVSEEKYDAAGKMRTWRQRKEGYLDRIRTAGPEAAAISLADKYHNLWSINESLARGMDLFGDIEKPETLNAGPTDQLWFYTEMIQIGSAQHDARFDALQISFEAELKRFTELIDVIR